MLFMDMTAGNFNLQCALHTLKSRYGFSTNRLVWNNAALQPPLSVDGRADQDLPRADWPPAPDRRSAGNGSHHAQKIISPPSLARIQATQPNPAGSASFR
jgi:hypothetical protein